MPPITTSQHPRPPVRSGGHPDAGGHAPAREVLRRPTTAWAAVVLATAVAFACPWGAALLTGSTVEARTRAVLTGALVAASVLAGGLLCVRGARTGRGDRRTAAWSVLGAGVTLWGLAAAVKVGLGELPVSGVGPGATSAWLQLTGATMVVIASALIPGDAPPSLQRRVDLALVAAAVLVGLWAIGLPLLVEARPGTPARAVGALVGAGWVVSAASLTMRGAPHRHSEQRGLTYALFGGGIALMLSAGYGPAPGYGPRSLLADLLWFTVGLALCVSGLRLRRPWVESPDHLRVADRVHAALPGLATVVALAVIAVAQRSDGVLDPLMISMGVLVVLLSGTRGVLMHQHNRRLFTRLLHSAEDLRHASRRDPLTGLGNRLALEERLATALNHHSPEGVSVFFIDIDNFKRVNDSLGHEAGDELLRVLGERLTGVMGGDVFRVGGDEFVAVREDVDRRDAEAMAAAVVAALGPAVQIGAHRFSTGASVGVARSEVRDDGRRRPDEPQLLLRRADLALYRAKELGRGQWATYEPWLQERADRRLALQQALRQAIGATEFEVFYQPVVDLRTGAVIGAEALVRWVSPTFGVLLPHEFVPIADEAALMPAIGASVLDQVIDHLARSPESTCWVAVNLSEGEILDPRIAERITARLAAASVDPGRLRVEVTERLVLEEAARIALDGLAAAGVGVCIEDFGTGPTSLRHLSGLHGLTLKLDRAFLGAPGHERDAHTILAAVVGLAGELGLAVAAEAITSARQAEELRRLGIREGQGWHFGRAARWEELPDLTCRGAGR